MKNLLSVLAVVLMVGTMSSNAEAAQCKVELKNGRGRLLEVFRGRGYDRMDACQDAKRQCRRVKRAGYYRARVQTCEVARRGSNRIVHRTCRATMTGPRGHRVIQSFLGQASGQRGMGIKGQACQRAMRQCRQAKRRSGRVRAICTDERGNGGYSPAPMPRYPRRGGRRGGRGL